MKKLKLKIQSILSESEIISSETFCIKNKYRTILRIKINNNFHTVIKTSNSRADSIKKAELAAKSMVLKTKGVQNDRVKNCA